MGPKIRSFTLDKKEPEKFGRIISPSDSFRVAWLALVYVGYLSHQKDGERFSPL
jgi:hypothetical protein